LAFVERRDNHQASQVGMDGGFSSHGTPSRAAIQPSERYLNGSQPHRKLSGGIAQLVDRGTR
jgi:hypothetical protein